MNDQSAKLLIETYGKLDSLPCWEIGNDNSPSRDKKYVWIIEKPYSEYYYPPNNTVAKQINVKNEFTIDYNGTINRTRPDPPICSAYFEFHTETPMKGVISKITVVQRSTTVPTVTVSSESDWMICDSGSKSKYRYSSSEQWKFPDYSNKPFPTFTVKVTDRGKMVYSNCIIVFIEFAHVPNADIFPVISDEQEREHAALATSKLFHSKKYADVQVVVKLSNGDGEEEEKTLMAHKAILAAGSSVFETMLETNMVEKKSSVIKIVDFEPEIIEELLKYLYTGKANLVDYAEQLLSCADKYDIQGLVDLCQKYFAQNMSTFGFNSILGLLQLYDGRVPILKKFAQEYFKMNENSLSQSEEFQTAVQLYPKEFVELYISKKRKREED